MNWELKCRWNLNRWRAPQVGAVAQTNAQEADPAWCVQVSERVRDRYVLYKWMHILGLYNVITKFMKLFQHLALFFNSQIPMTSHPPQLLSGWTKNSLSVNVRGLRMTFMYTFTEKETETQRG